MKFNGRQFVAGVQIVDGVCGLYFLLTRALPAIHTTREKILASGFTVLCILSIAAGILLWQSLSQGYRLSVLVQLAQLPVIVSARLAYDVGIGARAVFGVTRPFSFLLHFSFSGAMDVGFGTSSYVLTYGVNVVALALLIFLVVTRRNITRILEEKAIRDRT